jgi:allophanate hydrolase
MNDAAERCRAGPALGASDSLDIAELRDRYQSGTLTPSALVEGLLARIAARADDHVWIDLLSRDDLMALASRLEAEGPAGKPLYGIPFAIKDNIDLAGHPTTAACPAFAYQAQESAVVVQRLVAAGAIPIGKTNLDQFAAGLTGTRSPYGAPSCALRPGYVSGGSSSGSAVAVSAGLVSFALGTDTAGSGRVPAAFNNLIGLKPTRGLISTRGVVPACRSLDCVSVFALTAADALSALQVSAAFDSADPFSREPATCPIQPREIAGCRFGVPHAAQIKFFGNGEGERLFAEMLGRIERSGGRLVEVDFAPFLETARLLYHGPWIAERYVAIQEFFARHASALHPVTRQIIEGGVRPTAAEAFAGYYHLKELRRRIAPLWQAMDVLILPTAGRQYAIGEILADPIELNSALGYYTNFVNLLDLAGIAVPAGLQADGLAFGVTLLAPPWSDGALCLLADQLHRAQDLPLGAISDKKISAAPRPAAHDGQDGQHGFVALAVCGAHMAGLPLNHQLTERGGRLVRGCRTAARYRLFALPGGPPHRPGLVRGETGQSIEVEVWNLPVGAFGSFVAGIPAPLSIGSVELDDGSQVKGFLCEAHATADARDITEFGGWRSYLARQQAA